MAFYGACFGDIAGSEWEFSSFEKRKELDINNCISTYSHPTDDSIISCATAISLKNSIQLTKKELTYNNYNKENNYPFVDNPFTKIYRKITRDYVFAGAGYGAAFYGWALSDGKNPYGSMGNGSAMRISPIPEYFTKLRDVILYTIASAASTHNHPEGIKGAVITAVSIWMAKNGYSKQQIFNYMKLYYKPEYIQLYLKQNSLIQNFTMNELKIMIGPTICPFSVPAAVVCFFESNMFEDVINNVLSIGGDTDTIGAIACGIAGAYYGVPVNLRKIVDERKPEKIFDEALLILNKIKEN